MAIVNHDGTKIYGSTGAQILESITPKGPFRDATPAFEKGHARFYWEQQLPKKISHGDPMAQLALSRMRREIDAELDFVMIPLQKDIRLMTAGFLQDKGP